MPSVRTLFANGQVFDGTGSPPAGADVVVEDGRIVDVGPGLDGDEVVDCAGATVLPGFDRLPRAPAVQRRAPAEDAADAVLVPVLRGGRGTCGPRSTSASPPSATPAGPTSGSRTRSATGLIPGPRVLIAVSMLSQTGGHGDGWYPSGCTVPLVQPHPGPAEDRGGRAGGDPPDGPRADPGRRRRDQGRHQRRRAVGPGRPAARPLPGRGGGDDGARGRGGRDLGDGARAGHRGHQDRRTQRRPVHRARDLPRRRGDRADARLGHLAGADAGGAAGGAGHGRVAACRTRTRCWPRRGWCWRSTPSRSGGRSRPA